MKQLILTFINLSFDLAFLLIVLRAFLTYLPHNRYHPFIKPAYDITEPFLSVIRKGLPPSSIGMDASPFILLMLLYFLQQIIIKLIYLI